MDIKLPPPSPLELPSLNLPAPDIVVEQRRLRLNDYLQCESNPAVYVPARARTDNLGFRREPASDCYAARQARRTGGLPLQDAGRWGQRRLLGALLVGPHAELFINQFAPAMRHNLGARQMSIRASLTRQPRPTWAKCSVNA
jgi:hypothetical protein